MEVEFDVQMTSADLYDYMLHHTFTSPSGLIGAVAGALMIAAGFAGSGALCTIAGIVILLYLPVALFMRSKQQFLSNPAFRQPLHYRMDEEGITVSQGEHEECCKWEDMQKAISTMRSIVLYTSAVNATILPKKAMGEKTTAVIGVISTHMPPKKVKIRC